MKNQTLLGTTQKFFILFMLLLGVFSLNTKAQQYTANFATSPSFSDPNGWGNQWASSNNRATVTLNGINYIIDISQVTNWVFNGSGGESNSSCIRAIGASDVSVTIKRADEAKFAFYSSWISYSSNANYANKNMDYSVNNGAVISTYPANTTTTVNYGANVTSVKFFIYGCDVVKLDNIVVGAALPEVPKISTSSISIFTNTSALLGGNVTADGGAAVTERGIVYNTSGTPTISDTKVVMGDGIGTYSSTITGLLPNTTYYVRPYAKNSVGTAYAGTTGSSFTTAPNFVLAGNHNFNTAWLATQNQVSPFTKYVEGWDVSATSSGGNVSILRITGTATSISSAAEGLASLRGANVTTNEQLSSLVVKPNNNSSFSLQSLKIRYATKAVGQTFGTISLQGYKSGILISGALKAITGIQPNAAGANAYTLFDVSAISKFSNIDEFRITASDGSTGALLSYIDIDQMVVQNASASNPLSATIQSKTNISCNGGSNGSATVNATGGTAPYMYSWSPSGGISATATGLAAGNYTVTVTDATSATTSVPVSISQPTAISISTSSQTNVSCYGGSNGTASVNVTGGTPGYTYSWSPRGGTASTATGLSAGAYTVTITDANGCTKSQNFTITEPSVINTTTTQTNVSCNGGSNGTATVHVTGGAGGYSYSWSPVNGSGNSASGLSAGTYYVMITDANGCTKSQNFTITQPPVISISSGSQTNIACFGGSTGSITVNPTGGTSPYSYSWSPSGGTAKTASGLSAGTYSVTITDANGCTKSQSFTITQPSVMNATTVQTNVSCNGGSNGSATVNVTGGTSPYSYSWSPSGGIAKTATGLSAGTYNVTITDANGCTKSQNVTITQPSAMNTTTVQTNVSCNGGSNGTATVNVTGGAGGYSYSWSPVNGSGNSASGLPAGTYTVIITDANGCTKSQNFTITEPSVINTTTTQTNVSCNGGSNGTATVHATGGAGGYSYSWSPVNGSGNSASGLSAGTYYVVITDANGCTKSQNFTITQPPVISIPSSSQTNIACFGGSTGSITVNPTGGTSPYSYSWSPSGGTAKTASGLLAGTYSVTITDANGCTKSQSFTITQPSVMNATTVQTNVSCNGGSNGSATVNVTGGTSPYSYSWSPSGGIAKTATGLSAGTYNVTITDANGCTKSQSFTIIQPSAMNTTTVQTNVSCNGGSNGTATVNVTGGAGGYSYSWSPSGGTAKTASGLSAGTYNVTITDANGCTRIQNFTITQPSVINTTTAQTNVSCNGGSNGSATVNVTGGTSPYSYSWSPSGGTAKTASGLSAGTYNVIITDANGCTKSHNFTITQASALSITSSQTNVTINGGSNGSASVTVSGGANPYTYLWMPGGSTAATASGLSAGTYTATVTDAYGCTKSKSVVITEPSASSNNNLSGLSINPGTISPVFTAATLQYSASVASGVSTVVITPAKDDATSSVKINGFAVTSAYELTLQYGNNTASIVVTSQTGQEKTYTLTVVREIPQPGAPNIATASDTGESDTDNITNNNKPAFNGVSIPGSTINIYAGTKLIGTTVCDQSGNWNITSSALADGTYDVTCEILINGVSKISNSRKITIDTVDPVAVSITRLSPASSVTNLSEVTFNVAISEVVNHVTLSDFDIETSGTAQAIIKSISASTGNSFNVILHNITGSGAVKLLLRGPSTTVKDSAGNYMKTAFTTGEQYNVNVAPLAISLSNLHAVQKGTTVQLNWKALSDLTLLKFEIEKGSNSSVFKKVGEVATSSTSSTFKDYTFTDEKPMPGDNYYRLKMTDKNNTIKYSNVIKVKMVEDARLIKAVPNPVTNNTINLQLTNIKAGKYNLTLFNVNGKAVYSSQVTLNGFQAVLTVQLPTWVSRGVYTINLSNASETIKTQVIIQ